MSVKQAPRWFLPIVVMIKKQTLIKETNAIQTLRKLFISDLINNHHLNFATMAG